MGLAIRNVSFTQCCLYLSAFIADRIEYVCGLTLYSFLNNNFDWQDTAELFFEDMRVPASALLGEENKGFIYLMQELPQVGR